MAITIRTETPLSPDARMLLEASEAALRAVYPPEECFSYTAEELATKSTQFLVARQDGVPVGCVALVDEGRHGEVKRLFVAEAARGQGIGRRLMEELEQAARDIGLSVLMLETGEALAAASALYRALGFTERGPFEGYPDIASNLFMEKVIGVCPRGAAVETVRPGSRG